MGVLDGWEACVYLRLDGVCGFMGMDMGMGIDKKRGLLEIACGRERMPDDLLQLHVKGRLS